MELGEYIPEFKYLEIYDENSYNNSMFRSDLKRIETLPLKVLLLSTLLKEYFKKEIKEVIKNTLVLLIIMTICILIINNVEVISVRSYAVVGLSINVILAVVWLGFNEIKEGFNLTDVPGAILFGFVLLWGPVVLLYNDISNEPELNLVFYLLSIPISIAATLSVLSPGVICYVWYRFFAYLKDLNKIRVFYKWFKSCTTEFNPDILLSIYNDIYNYRHNYTYPWDDNANARTKEAIIILNITEDIEKHKIFKLIYKKRERLKWIYDNKE